MSINPYGGVLAIDKRIGNAYPAVKKVADNIDAVVYLAEHLVELRPRNVEFRRDPSTGDVQWHYTDGDDPWKTMLQISDIQAPKVEMGMDGTILSWRYVGETDDEWRGLWNFDKGNQDE